MPLKLFNTLKKKKQTFKPLSKTVGLYTCGPTVYHYAHIGNLRSYIFEDILKRTLLFNDYKVNHIMNITDVGHLTSDADDGEDKMTKGLKREGLPLTKAGMKKLAAKYTKAFVADLKKLNIILPNKMPSASEHIKEDIQFIETLEKKGYTYNTTDGIYFDTSKLKDYGKLLGAKTTQNEGHARIKNTEKRQPQDFALWKFNKDLGWQAKIGKGFPGWHIECSVMASKYLGEQFDIHCGGIEHIPIHHTNEIAQSEAAFGKKPWVKFWLHNEWLVLGKGEKMAKSGGNFITMDVLEQKQYSPLDYRYFCFGTIYRKPLAFSFKALDAAKTARKKLFDKTLEIKSSGGQCIPKYINKFMKEINDDLNTSKALATTWQLLKDSKISNKDKYATLLHFDRILGFNLGKLKKQTIPANIKKLAEQRLEARNNKDWKKSDLLRDKINKLGYQIDDTKEGFEISKI